MRRAGELRIVELMARGDGYSVDRSLCGCYGVLHEESDLLSRCPCPTNNNFIFATRSPISKSARVLYTKHTQVEHVAMPGLCHRFFSFSPLIFRISYVFRCIRPLWASIHCRLALELVLSPRLHEKRNASATGGLRFLQTFQRPTYPAPSPCVTQ